MRRWLSVAACALIGVLMSGAPSLAAAELVVIVSAESAVQTLSRDHLADIYLGRLRRFPDGSIVIPIDQAERSRAREVFYREHLGLTLDQVKVHWSKLVFTGRGQPPRTVRDGAAMVEAVARNPNAIGYVDAALVDERLRVVTIR